MLTYTAKAALKAAADLIANSLNASGWAVCDHFAPAELVANVRRELAQLIPLYEPSEIWVGKEAGVGAQVYLFLSSRLLPLWPVRTSIHDIYN